MPDKAPDPGTSPVSRPRTRHRRAFLDQWRLPRSRDPPWPCISRPVATSALRGPALGVRFSTGGDFRPDSDRGRGLHAERVGSDDPPSGSMVIANCSVSLMPLTHSWTWPPSKTEPGTGVPPSIDQSW